ncbi:MAG TPA: hypothetical protein VIW24_05415 [Aldersonia sp.]
MAILLTVVFVAVQPPGKSLLHLVLDVAVDVLLVLAGYLLILEPGQRVTGGMLIAVAGCWLLSTITVPFLGPFPFVGTVVLPLFWLLVCCAVLRYPDQRFTVPGARLFVAIAAFWLGVGHIVVILSYDPRWDGWSADVWWPTVVANPDLFRALSIVSVYGDAALAMYFLFMVARRIRQLGGVDRWVLAPLIGSVFATGIVVMMRSVDPRGGWSAEILRTATSAAVLGVSAAFVVAVVRRQLAQIAVTEVVGQLAIPRSGLSALRRLAVTLEFDFGAASCETTSITAVSAKCRRTIATTKAAEMASTAPDVAVRRISTLRGSRDLITTKLPAAKTDPMSGANTQRSTPPSCRMRRATMTRANTATRRHRTPRRSTAPGTGPRSRQRSATRCRSTTHPTEDRRPK